MLNLIVALVAVLGMLYMMIALGGWLTTYPRFWNECSVGFSGVIFALITAESLTVSVDERGREGGGGRGWGGTGRREGDREGGRTFDNAWHLDLAISHKYRPSARDVYNVHQAHLMRNPY